MAHLAALDLLDQPPASVARGPLADEAVLRGLVPSLRRRTNRHPMPSAVRYTLGECDHISAMMAT
jgi:hypothetical protein